MSEQNQGGSNLHRHILIGLVLGAICGIAVNQLVKVLPNAQPTVDWLLKNIMGPIGQVFRRLLIMTVIPLVFASLAVGVARLGDLGKLGRIGAKTFGYFFLSTACAVIIGLTLVQLINPGSRISDETRTGLEMQYRSSADEKLKPIEFGVDTFVRIVPDNPIRAAADMDMLAVIFVALMVGLGLTRIAPERSRPVLQFLEGVGDLAIFIIHLAMRIAPFGVFALIFTTSARFGFELLRSLGIYVGVVLLGLSIQMFVVYPVLIRTLGGMSPLYFFRKVRGVIVTAFSTSSSNATLPTSIAAAEEGLRIPAPLAGFVLPLGATMNMNGTALFEGVTVVFLAQVFGVPLTLGQQAVVVVMSVLTAIGAAGVPGGSIPLLGMVLATVGVDPGAIAIILGVDRILDMCRTTLNVVGDLTAVVFVARSEGQLPAPELPEKAN